MCTLLEMVCESKSFHKLNSLAPSSQRSYRSPWRELSQGRGTPECHTAKREEVKRERNDEDDEKFEEEEAEERVEDEVSFKKRKRLKKRRLKMRRLKMRRRLKNRKSVQGRRG